MIGPIPRYVFGSKYDYNLYERSIKVDANNVWKDINQMEVFKVPNYVKKLAAPYVRGGVDIPIIGEACFVDEDNDNKDMKDEVDIYQFRFLSSYCAKLVSENVKNKLQVNISEISIVNL